MPAAPVDQRPSMPAIRIADLAAQHVSLRAELLEAIGEVLAEGQFVLGPRVAAFEAEFARYCGAPLAVAVNSGTSALHLTLLAAGVGPGDEVVVPAFTFVATIAAVGYTGARPVLVDIEPDTLTLDPDRLTKAVTARTRAVVPVHLYGHPAEMDRITTIAGRHGLAVIEDAAQAHGAEYRGRRTGTLGDAACFSFYPSKNLGACGEGGLVVTARRDLADRIRHLRDWGQETPYRHVVRGFNCRMDAIQGAVLDIKLRYLDAWNAARRRNAARYDAALGGTDLVPPTCRPDVVHVYHQYVVRSADREPVRARLARRGIETRVHYPEPLHLCRAWADLGYHRGDFPVAEAAAREVFSIPVHPELREEEVVAILDALACG